MISTKGIERRIRQHVYAADHEFFAVVQPGFEDIVGSEITGIGGADIAVTEGGVTFHADIETVWKIHLASGGITRVLMRLASFKVIYFEKLYEKIADIPWELHLAPAAIPGISVSTSHSRLYHSGRIEQECRNAVSDRLKSIYGDNTVSGETETGKQTVFVRMEDDRCTVSLDCTGEPLYRRGFRTFVEKAPLRETIASMILRFARVGDYDVLCDPMCGSGVIPIEGALMSRGILPGIRRSFAFEKWPGHSEKGFAYTKRMMTEHAQKFPLEIIASDVDPKAVESARKNIEQLGCDGINISQHDFFDYKIDTLPHGRILFVMNPPYGERITIPGNTDAFYRSIGEKLRSDFKNCGFAIIVPGIEAERSFGLSYDRKIAFMNGGIRVTLLVRDGIMSQK